MKTFRWEKMSNGDWFIYDSTNPGILLGGAFLPADRWMEPGRPFRAAFRPWKMEERASLFRQCASVDEAIIQVQCWASLLGHRFEELHWGGVAP